MDYTMQHSKSLLPFLTTFAMSNIWKKSKEGTNRKKERGATRIELVSELGSQTLSNYFNFNSFQYRNIDEVTLITNISQHRFDLGD